VVTFLIRVGVGSQFRIQNLGAMERKRGGEGLTRSKGGGGTDQGTE
jgi:hypothetical protein